MLARDEDESFEANAATEQMLLEAIAPCERGQTLPVEQVLHDAQPACLPQQREANEST